MKKPYITFAAVLVLLAVVLSYTSGYLEVLEESSKNQNRDEVKKSELEQFKQQVDQRFSEQQESTLKRLDSLEAKIEKSFGRDTVTGVQTGEDRAAPEVVDNKPSQKESDIYAAYLKKRWALPADLTAYELKIAKNEILTELGKKHGYSGEEILQLIDKVYEYRKTQKKK